MYSFSQNYYTGDNVTVLGFARSASTKLLALVKGSTTLKLNIIIIEFGLELIKLELKIFKYYSGKIK